MASRALLSIALIHASFISGGVLSYRVDINKIIMEDLSTIKDKENISSHTVSNSSVAGGADGWLMVLCQRAKNLKDSDIVGDHSDPFCQMELLGSGGSFSSLTSTYRDNQGDPEWGRDGSGSAAFDMKCGADLSSFKVKLSVWDADGVYLKRKFGNMSQSKELLGSTVIELPPAGAEDVVHTNEYGNVSAGKTIPGAWERTVNDVPLEGGKGTISYRIRWCPYMSVDMLSSAAKVEETNRWKSVRKKEREDSAGFGETHGMSRYAPHCIIEGQRTFGATTWNGAGMSSWGGDGYPRRREVKDC